MRKRAANNVMVVEARGDSAVRVRRGARCENQLASYFFPTGSGGVLTGGAIRFFLPTLDLIWSRRQPINASAWGARYVAGILIILGACAALYAAVALVLT